MSHSEMQAAGLQSMIMITVIVMLQRHRVKGWLNSRRCEIRFVMAHDPLHEVGDVLLAIPELAKKENVDSEKLASIQKAVDTLMDAFGRVDKTMHGQEGSTYAEESATIDAAVLELEALLNPSATSKPDAATPDVSATETPATPSAETTSPAEAPAASNPN